MGNASIRLDRVGSTPLFYAAGFLAFLCCLITFYLVAPEDKSSSLTSPGERKSLTIFDSAFWASGSAAEPDFESLITELNPLTGETFTKTEIERITKLYKMFPENSLLPRPARDRFRKEREQEKLNTLSKSITAGTATEQDIQNFYSARRREIKDRKELVEFVLTENWEEEVLNGYRNMLERDKILEKNLEEELAASLEIKKNRAH